MMIPGRTLRDAAWLWSAGDADVSDDSKMTPDENEPIPLPYWGYSMVERLRPYSEALTRAFNLEEIARRRAAFDALPWWRKAWLRWRSRW